MSTLTPENGGILEFENDSGINNIVSRKGGKTQTLKLQTGTVSKKIKRPDKLSGNRVIGMESSSKKDKVLKLGPLESIFSGSESKILDFLITFQKYDYSISDIAKNSGVGFKTTLGIVKRLEEKSILFQKRTVGRAKMYVLNPDSQEAKSINKLALDIAAKRAIE